MKIYNTLTRRKEQLVPIKEGQIGFYVCGPTVYNHVHIGNARTFVSFDVIRRYLTYSGYQVTFVQNITDVDDKIINAALEEGVSTDEIAAKYTEAFIAVMDRLGVEPPTVRPRATQELDQMIALIEQLIAAGYAYQVDGDVYFSVRSFSSYGALSGRDIDQLLSGARIEVDERKRDALDFALWKAAKPGEPAWPSPWGQGRPGWHIECSAMSRRYLGRSFDIHGGGEDLVFPHHENEIAQSQAAGDGFARYWLHGGMLTINQEKMSKSLGNYLLLKDVLEHVKPTALRLWMLQSHYRSPFDYSPERLEEATLALARIENSLRNLEWLLATHDASEADSAAAHQSPADDRADSEAAAALTAFVQKARESFALHMDDDFNTAAAVAAVYELITEANTSVSAGIIGAAHRDAVETACQTILELMAVLGIALTTETTVELPAELLQLAVRWADYQGTDLDQALSELLAVRQQARAERDWARADAVRDGLEALGLTIEDTAEGPRAFMA